MNRQGGSILLLLIGALLVAAPLVIQEVRLGENRRVLQERNSQVAAPAAPGENPGDSLRAESRRARAPLGGGTPTPPPLAADETVTTAPTESVPAAVQSSGFRIQIPALDLDWAVMGDIGNAELAVGPGQYPGTAGPGSAGNLAIAGHRTHRGEPSYFYPINRLAPGDQIIIKGTSRVWVYQVERLFIISAYDLSVLAPSSEPILTLTTCDPPGTEDKRLIVRARLVSHA
jgi:sortase A